jgi:hypothetical protein
MHSDYCRTIGRFTSTRHPFSGAVRHYLPAMGRGLPNTGRACVGHPELLRPARRGTRHANRCDRHSVREDALR